MVLEDTEDLSSESVRDALEDVYARREEVVARIQLLNIQSATPMLLKLIRETMRN